MREIKFRAWDGRKSKYHEGYIAVGVDGVMRLDCNGEFIDTSFEAEQFTGLLDKNGTEIYEGDVIQSATHRESKHLIVWSDEFCRFNAAFICQHGELDECSLYNSWVDECEKVVIGNIHENPELLEA